MAVRRVCLLISFCLAAYRITRENLDFRLFTIRLIKLALARDLPFTVRTGDEITVVSKLIWDRFVCGLRSPSSVRWGRGFDDSRHNLEPEMVS